MSTQRKDIISEEGFNTPGALKKEFEGLRLELEKHIKTIKQVNQAFSKNPGLKESKTNTDKLTASQKELIKIQNQIVSTKGRLIASTKDEAKQLAALKVQQQDRNKRLKDEAKAMLSGTQALNKLNKERAQAQLRLKSLIAAQELSGKVTKQGNAEIRKAQAEFNRLDKSYIKVQRSARQFNDNVGNYSSAFGKATGAVRNLAGALGLLGGATAVVSVFRDAAKRIRDFDREVTNLAAIAGKTRKDIQPLEKQIISVAGSSTKTANEVAGLATELIKLGSTTEEAAKLLKPVNDFAIALRASSEESAAFLKGVLNAFGEGADEANRFADVLASAANRSALDFQGLTESFGFVAPTAKQLGISVETLAAQIGTLADNNVKASRAGRLLNTSFARLVSRGMTLDQALDQIRNSTDKVRTATGLFGAEAFTIGLILADNEKKVADLTKEFENSKGSLETLTNTQLKSLDSQLKILDSTYEELILTFENGEGVLSKVTTGIIDLANAVLNSLIAFEKISSSDYLAIYEKIGLSIGQAIPIIGKFVNSGLLEYLEEIDVAVDKTLEGIDKDFQFGFKGLEGDALREQISNIRFFEKQLFENLVKSGVSFENAEKAANIWAENTIIEFSKVAKGIKDSGVADAVDDIKDGFENFVNAFASSLQNLNVEEINNLLDETKRRQAELIAEFDRIGGSSVDSVENMTDAQKALKQEIENVGNQVKMLNNVITVFSERSVEEIDKVRAIFKKTFEEISKNQNEAFEDDIEGFQDYVGKIIREKTKEIKLKEELDKKYAERQEQIQQAAADATIQIFNQLGHSYFDTQRLQLDAALHRLETVEDIEISSLENRLEKAEKGSKEEQRLEAQLLERKKFYANEEAKIKERQARIDKQQALFEIAIQTAVAIAEASPIVPLMAIAAAVGAVQAAIVAARPIPQYAEGTRSSERDFIAGEEGSELMKRNGKYMLTPDQPTLYTNMKGTEIIPHEETTKILARTALSNISINDRKRDDRKVIKELQKGFKYLGKEIRSKPAYLGNGTVQVNGTRIKKFNRLRNV